jgi:hypothetical protein
MIDYCNSDVVFVIYYRGASIRWIALNVSGGIITTSRTRVNNLSKNVAKPYLLLLLSFLGFVFFSLYVHFLACLFVAWSGFGLLDQLPFRDSSNHASMRRVGFFEGASVRVTCIFL